MPHPHGPECRCPTRSNMGLLQYTVDCEHYRQLAAHLAQIAARPDTQTATLRVLTTETPAGALPLDAVQCDGSMLCRCPACDNERAERVRTGIRRVKQPWEIAA